MDLASFPLDNPAWSTTNTLAAAQACQAQVAAYAAGNALQVVTLLCKGTGGSAPYVVGALLDPTALTFNTSLTYAGAIVSSMTIREIRLPSPSRRFLGRPIRFLRRSRQDPAGL
jgi:hypothetical protein